MCISEGFKKYLKKGKKGNKCAFPQQPLCDTNSWPSDLTLYSSKHITQFWPNTITGVRETGRERGKLGIARQCVQCVCVCERERDRETERESEV